MKLELFIALKYLFGRKHNIFATITTIIAIFGITLGVSCLIVTLGVMTGFHNDIQKKILGLNPHIIILNSLNEKIQSSTIEKIKTIKEIKNFSPFVYGQVILKTKSGVSGVLLKGIDIENEKKVIDGIDKIFTFGSLPETDSKKIVLGKELIKNLNTFVGNDIILIIPQEQSGMSFPAMYKFNISGVFSSGMYDYDSNLTFIDIHTARKILSNQAIEGIGVKINNFDKITSVRDKLIKILGKNLRIISYQELNKNLFAALKLEKVVMILLLTLIIIVACFNIVSNMLLLGIEKSKEIGILSALGLNRKRIRKIFLIEGSINGLIGTLFGVILGIIICFVLQKYQFISLPADVYYVNKLPVKLVFNDIILVVIISIGTTILSTIYPANKLSKLNPIEIIRYG